MGRVKDFFYSAMEEYENWAETNGDDPEIREEFETLITKLIQGDQNELKISSEKNNNN